jgi:hypothetical protein
MPSWYWPPGAAPRIRSALIFSNSQAYQALVLCGLDILSTQFGIWHSISIRDVAFDLIGGGGRWQQHP